MEMAIYIYTLAGILLALFLLIMAAYGVFCLRRGRRAPGMALLAVITFVLTAAAYGAFSFYNSVHGDVEAQTAIYEEQTLAAARKDYHGAIKLLAAASLGHLEADALKKAQEALEKVAASSCAGEPEFRDTPVLLAHTRLLLAASTYKEGLKSIEVSKDKELLALAAEIPTDYQGELAGKILPVRQIIFSMKAQGEKELQQDARDMEEYQENLRQGRSGLIAKGDPESKLVSVLGQPDHVNEPSADLKQYVFLHNSHNVYVYTKNGVVTEVRGL